MLEAVAVSVVVILPSAMLSSTPVTVMVWGVFQFDGLKLSVSALMACSEPSLPVIATLTVPVGCASRMTVNDDDEPASVVSRLPELSVVPVWVMLMPLLSLSVLRMEVTADSVPS